MSKTVSQLDRAMKDIWNNQDSLRKLFSVLVAARQLDCFELNNEHSPNIEEAAEIVEDSSQKADLIYLSLEKVFNNLQDVHDEVERITNQDSARVHVEDVVPAVLAIDLIQSLEIVLNKTEGPSLTKAVIKDVSERLDQQVLRLPHLKPIQESWNKIISSAA